MIEYVESIIEQYLVLKYVVCPILMALTSMILYFFVKQLITELYFKFISRGLDIKQGTVILLTGGSSGIGYEVCEHLAKNHTGIILIILDIVENATQVSYLTSNYNIHAEFVQCDLSQTQQVEDTFKRIVTKHKTVDILINNAAVALIQYFDTLTIERFFKAEQINLLSYMQLTHLYLNQENLINDRCKHILFMGSVAGFQAGLKTTEYASSKFGLVMFNEALRGELKIQHKYSNVRLTIINPYQVDTELFKGFSTIFKSIMPTLNLQKVSSIVYTSLIQRRNIVFISWYYEIAIFIVSSLPVWGKDFIGLISLSSTVQNLVGKKDKFPGYVDPPSK